MTHHHFLVLWILRSLFDQQSIIAIAFQTVGFTKMSTMTHYHFFISWYLSFVSTVVHLGTMLALVNSWAGKLGMRIGLGGGIDSVFD